MSDNKHTSWENCSSTSRTHNAMLRIEFKRAFILECVSYLPSHPHPLPFIYSPRMKHLMICSAFTYVATDSYKSLHIICSDFLNINIWGVEGRSVYTYTVWCSYVHGAKMEWERVWPTDKRHHDWCGLDTAIVNDTKPLSNRFKCHTETGFYWFAAFGPLDHQLKTKTLRGHFQTIFNKLASLWR